jgi:glycosyltransferase involved in cell wall biosynthesis
MVVHYNHNKSPLVSIVIPCYNAAGWIAAAVRSAQNQTYPNVEIIVIDDGSTDRSTELLLQFPKIKLLNASHGGPSAARNKGLRLASGAWIQFLDADDILHPEKIELSLKAVEMHPNVEFVWAPTVKFSGAVPNMGSYLGGRTTGVLSQRNVLRAAYAPCAAIFRRTVLDRAGNWNEGLSRWVDLEYHARIAALMPSFVSLETPLYYYRQHHGPQISAANGNFTQIEAGTKALAATRQVLEGSAIPREDWEWGIFPFYILLARAAGREGNIELFREMLTEAAVLRKSWLFGIKCRIAESFACLFGVKNASTAIEFLLTRQKKVL